MKIKIYSILAFLFICSIAISQVANREHFIHESTFRSALSSNLDGLVKGYQYTVGDESGVLFSDVFGDRRSANDNAGTAASWTINNKMMGASVAKMVGTVAIMNILESTNIPGAPALNDKLEILLQDYIPLRWRTLINGNESQIQLKHLLNHQSGIPQGNADPQVALSGTMNASLPAGYTYANPNLDLACFMITYLANPTVMANLELLLAGEPNAVYDAAFKGNIRSLYQSYVQSEIFAPAGISVECGSNISDPATVEVYGYSSPGAEIGSDIGNISTCMSNGWIWSTEDMTKFVQKWTNPSLPGNILTAASVALINDFPNGATTSPLGWNRDRDTNIGEGYAHGGLWLPSNDTYRSRMILTQDNVIMNIHVNSDAPANLGGYMSTAYNAAVCAPDILIFNSFMKKYNSAENTIVTSEILEPIIDNGETVVFKAGDRVTLTPGFRAEPGSVFRAYIDTCNNLPTE